MEISNDKSNLKKEEETDTYKRSTNPNDAEIEKEQNGNNANQNENILESEKNINIYIDIDIKFNIKESEGNILFRDEAKAKNFANEADINGNNSYFVETHITNKSSDTIEQEVTNYTEI